MTRVILVLAAIFSFQAQAKIDLKVPGMDKYLTLGSVETVDLTEQYETAHDGLFINSTETLAAAQCTPGLRQPKQKLTFSVVDDAADWLGNLDQTELILDKVINIGKKVWDIVEKGRPVVNIQTDVATALPQGSNCWLDLQGWSAPQTKVWGTSFKNLYGVEVAKFVYRVLYLPGGGVNGQGRYIGYATVQPVEVNVAWGYTFNAQVSVPTVFNQGTRENPVAGMNINVAWSVKTVLKHVEQTQAYFVNGLGEMQQLQ